ncbi:hypothetical protein FHS89_000126 [Rubricella aquisinus]|uniref:Sulfotransferase domain-containing protein n=1 Tax=Rubricella aquisinus TaxID=2028108 RepID=A0A840WG44_9RHOB|nr:hypothetical protein [Rubricella aquisinus]MBB5514128.1 hypothetical protein [Rubricella aquisinus]
MEFRSRYVISAPRSGLNWLRYCVEHFWALRTPGITSLIDRRAQPQPAFLRSHDAEGQLGAFAAASHRPVPEAAAHGPLLLILRDPLESYVRMADQALPAMAGYVGNLRYFARHPGPKRVAYYEDLTTDPAAMRAAILHLGLPEHMAPSVDDMAAEWDALARASRASYAVNQKRGGGPQTADDPQNFTFHQQRLNAQDKARVWAYLEAELTEAERAPLTRYRKDMP